MAEAEESRTYHASQRTAPIWISAAAAVVADGAGGDDFVKPSSPTRSNMTVLHFCDLAL